MNRFLKTPLSISELALLEAVIYLILWLTNDYLATILSTSFALIAAFVLLIAGIAEWIEPSKVSRSFFSFMIVSIIVPLLIGAFFMYLKNGTLDWMVFRLNG